jgi:hypothetical protein
MVQLHTPHKKLGSWKALSNKIFYFLSHIINKNFKMLSIIRVSMMTLNYLKMELILILEKKESHSLVDRKLELALQELSTQTGVSIYLMMY